MIEKGFAQTTLADVAIAANMSSSHLLYYFNGKEAILQTYFQNLAQQIINRLNEIRTEEPRKQIDQLADLFFAGSSITKSVIGLMLECFGAVVHDKILQQEKTELDAKCKSYLVELMGNTPGGFLADANKDAEVAYVTLIGLRTAVYFDKNFELDEARHVFHRTMLKITGLEPEK